MRSWDFRRLMAVALVLTTAFVTMPLSAADFSTARPVIGSVSAVGSVDLRGVGISQEGTLFSGDRIQANAKGYAKVLIGTSKIELSEKTDVSVNRDAKGVQIAMNSGLVGFTAHSPLRIDVAPFEVTASDDASGNVAIMNPLTAGVRAINGKVTVRNLKTSESFVITKGHEQFLGLKDGVHGPSLGELAANVPGPVPAPKPAPQTPAGKTSGSSMDTGAWLAVIGGAAVGAIAIWALVEAKNNKDDVDSLGKKIDTLTSTVAANQAANAAAIAAANAANAAAIAAANAKITAVSNAAALANNVAQQQAQLALLTALNAQAQATLANNAAQLAIAKNIQGQIDANNTALVQLQADIAAAQAAGNTAAIPALLARVQAFNASNNTLGGSLKALLSNNGIQGGNSIGSVGLPTISSASVPV